jgi:sec-independent protein translocase protein TatA
MGDFAKGIKSFKKGLSDEDQPPPPPPPPRVIDADRRDETSTPNKDTTTHS